MKGRTEGVAEKQCAKRTFSLNQQSNQKKNAKEIPALLCDSMSSRIRLGYHLQDQQCPEEFALHLGKAAQTGSSSCHSGNDFTETISLGGGWGRDYCTKSEDSRDNGKKSVSSADLSSMICRGDVLGHSTQPFIRLSVKTFSVKLQSIRSPHLPKDATG